jgi:hypothetical protein
MEQILATLPQMINEKQAARILSVSVAALRRWRHENRGPKFARLERCIRYNIRELAQFLEQNSSGHERSTGSGSVPVSSSKGGI